jgi:Fe-S cluster biosynthesis and repair protein YggX
MTDKLMADRRGLVMGVANDHSIAWGIAKKLAEHGAELAFTYQGEQFGRRVKPLAEKLGAPLVLPCDVEDKATVEDTFAELERAWGSIDFVVHAIGFSDRNELKGLYADTSRENFVRTMVISCFSFTEVARMAARMMPQGGQARAGFERPPFPGKIGARVVEQICQDCWAQWNRQQMMLINHYGLNLMDPQARKFLTTNMEAFLFGAGQGEQVVAGGADGVVAAQALVERLLCPLCHDRPSRGSEWALSVAFGHLDCNST